MFDASAVPIAALQWESRACSLCVATGRLVYVLSNALVLKDYLFLFLMHNTYTVHVSVVLVQVCKLYSTWSP